MSPRERVQCATCPWKVGADVNQIPGYDPDRHRGLTSTIARPGVFPRPGAHLRVMACHYSAETAQTPCVGWVAHQLGDGNNLPLRVEAIKNPDAWRVRTVGPQHPTFEATLPPRRPR